MNDIDKLCFGYEMGRNAGSYNSEKINPFPRGTMEHDGWARGYVIGGAHKQDVTIRQAMMDMIAQFRNNHERVARECDTSDVEGLQQKMKHIHYVDASALFAMQIHHVLSKRGL